MFNKKIRNKNCLNISLMAILSFISVNAYALQIGVPNNQHNEIKRQLISEITSKSNAFLNIYKHKDIINDVKSERLNIRSISYSARYVTDSVYGEYGVDTNGMTCFGTQCFYGTSVPANYWDANNCKDASAINFGVNVEPIGTQRNKYTCAFKNSTFKYRYKGGIRRYRIGYWINHYRCYPSKIRYTVQNNACNAFAELVDTSGVLIPRNKEYASKWLNQGDDAIFEVGINPKTLYRAESRGSKGELVLLAGANSWGEGWIGENSKPYHRMKISPFQYGVDVDVRACTDKIDPSNVNCSTTRYSSTGSRECKYLYGFEACRGYRHDGNSSY